MAPNGTAESADGRVTCREHRLSLQIYPIFNSNVRLNMPTYENQTTFSD